MGLLVNIDNGGTFTDVCIRDGDNVVHAKSPTTPHDLTQCFVQSLTRVSSLLYGEEDLGRLMRETDYLRYSTTAGTNAVVERKGTPVALIVEKGHEAAVYGARKQVGDEGLWHALVVGEPAGLTVGAGNKIDEAELPAVINRLLSQGAQRLVIALRSAEAEANAKDLLLEKYPRHLLGAVPFMVSFELVKDEDHARRTVSALINSYLHPGMEHFLYGAENVCKGRNLANPLLIFRNDGNSARVAKTTAIKTWGSGPRGGLEGSLAYARLYNAQTLATMDIGGTTTDVAVACDGQIKLDARGEIEGSRVSFPIPEMHSFGLGGSSVIKVDKGEIVIGPESVGAAPGPACFGRGGTAATLTDALLLAGVLDAKRYLGGELQLDAERASAALSDNIGKPLKLSLDETVSAVIAAFAAKAGEHIRHAIKHAGRKPEQTTLLAFGGGGPMIVTAIAEAAGVKTVIVPHMAAVFSAFGIGFSNLAHEYSQPVPADGKLEQIQAEMLRRAQRDMEGEGVKIAECEFLFHSWTEENGVIVERPMEKGGKKAVVTQIGLRAVYRLPVFNLKADKTLKGSAPKAVGQAEVKVDKGKPAKTPVYSADDLTPGKAADGPALIRGDYLTCLIRAGWRLRVSPNHDLIIEVA